MGSLAIDSGRNALQSDAASAPEGRAAARSSTSGADRFDSSRRPSEARLAARLERLLARPGVQIVGAFAVLAVSLALAAAGLHTGGQILDAGGPHALSAAYPYVIGGPLLGNALSSLGLGFLATR